MTGNFNCHDRWCYEKKLSLMAILDKYSLIPASPPMCIATFYEKKSI